MFDEFLLIFYGLMDKTGIAYKEQDIYSIRLKFSHNDVQHRPAVIGYMTRILINIYARKLKE